MQISKLQARRFLLAHQGLLPPHSLSGKTGVLSYLRQVGCIQYDPLNIVGHNPELVLQSRLADFQPELLRQLLYEDRLLIDGWDKLMAIYPAEDWPYFQRMRLAQRRNSAKHDREIIAARPHVLAAINAQGPLSANELSLSDMVDWDWSQSSLARAALDSLFFQGELLVHHRIHTRKYYDLSSRCLPDHLLVAPDPNRDEKTYQDWYVHRRLGSVGLLWNRAGEAWLGMHAIKSRERTAALNRLEEQGHVRQVDIEGFSVPFYYRSLEQDLLDRVVAAQDQPSRAAILAPLDNLLWDRRFLEELFDFYYPWEVYVPAAKRVYGYYVLPVLYGERFIARFEPGFDRQSGVLTVKNWWWESEVALTDELRAALVDCFQRFQRYLGAVELRLRAEIPGRAKLAWLAEAAG